MEDPVSILNKEFPYNSDGILASSCGGAYVAIMLTNGQIGVCSTLNKPLETDPLLLDKPDLKNFDDRVLVTAFANANLNYLPENLSSGDIFEQIDFTKKLNTVMVGYFPPLVEKFTKSGIPLAVFDQLKDYPGLTPINQLAEKLKQADCVIITSTTLINSTFVDIVTSVNPGTNMFMLGPSTPLNPVFKKQYNITSLFGMIFKPYDFQVLEMISKGFGTPVFGKKGNKVSL